jgi:hypothetical protein
MKIALHDSEFNTKYPNLALMKISAYHKECGDQVEWFGPLFSKPDKIYSSKVFTFTPEDSYIPKETEKGGTGYGDMKTVLPDYVEHICPDYDLYSQNYSMGFLTRGCIRNCEGCFVPGKEGSIRPNADIDEFARHKDVVLMDNNVLACDHGIDQIKKIIQEGLKVDFNQGLDARLIDDGVAKILSKVKWLEPLRLACDSVHMIKHIQKAVQLLRWHNTTPVRFFCYVLVRDIEDALERVKFLKGMNIDPFCQPYMDKEGTPPTKEQESFARYVNVKSNFKTCTWEDYKWK